VRTTPVESSVAVFREAFPLGSTNQVIAVEDCRYAGMVIVAEAHAAELAATLSVRQLCTTAITCCCHNRYEAEALPVVNALQRW